jgi:hypothetical protein
MSSHLSSINPEAPVAETYFTSECLDVAMVSIGCLPFAERRLCPSKKKNKSSFLSCGPGI